MNFFHRHHTEKPHSLSTRPGRWRRISHRTLQVVLVVAIVLLAIRLALPFAIKRYVNQKLNEIPDYRGHVDDIDLSLWRGAYTMHDVFLAKMSGKVPVPLFTAPTVDLSMQWRELFHGAIVGEIVMDRPEVNFVAGPTDDTSQTTVDSS